MNFGVEVSTEIGSETSLCFLPPEAYQKAKRLTVPLPSEAAPILASTMDIPSYTSLETLPNNGGFIVSLEGASGESELRCSRVINYWYKLKLSQELLRLELPKV